MTPPEEITRTVGPAADASRFGDFFIEPPNVRLAALDDRQRDDFRHVVAVELDDPVLETREEIGPALNDEQFFFRALHTAAPAVGRSNAGDTVHASRKPLFDQRR